MDLKDVLAGTKPPAQSQNLINQSKIITVSRPPGFYKSIVLDVITVGSAGLFGWLYYRYLTVGLPVWYLLAGLAFFGILTALEVFLARNAGRSIFVIILEVAALLIFFYSDDLRILGVTGAAVLVILLWGHFSSRQQLTNSVEVSFFRVSGNALGKFMTALLIFMILTYVPQLGSGNAFVSPQNFRTFFDWASGVVGGFYPGVTLNDSFGTFAQGVAKMELASNSNFQALNAAQKDQAISDAATQFESNFANSAAAPVNSSTPTSDAFYDIVMGGLAAWQSNAGSAFAIGWAIVLFLILRSLGIIFVWLDQFLTLIFYEILLASGFMKITEETSTKEVLGY
jgi:hypothetical protein